MLNHKSYDIIIAPVITEKATLSNQFNQYIFKVSKDATKDSVKSFIEAEFSVNVQDVNIINVKGKVKRFKGKIGRRASYKKAIVKLADGQTISIS
jgi:large subunit ribosomal protein L23